MNKNQILKTLVVTSTFIFAGNALAEADHETNEDFVYSVEKLNELNLSSLSIVNDDQFVFNDELALMDWDIIFDGYVPSLKEHQTTIMHYAGFYSINPKILISLMEAKSGILTNPTEQSIAKPFGDLSNKASFAEQVKDVASQLTKRFYAFRRLSHDQESTQRHLLKLIVPTSAATVAIKGVLTTHDKDNVIGNDDFYNFFTAYENVFLEGKTALLNQHVLVKNNKPISNESANKPQTSAAAAAPTMYLPWSSGWSWRAGGAHGNDGSSWPLSALDFYYPSNNGGWGGNKPYVYSAHGGTVTRYSSCSMRVTHSSGIATSYYHMDNLQYNTGSYVNAGTYIGRYANNYNQALCQGGQSTGPHLHMALLRNGYWESLNGYYLSGYYVKTGSSQYDSNCSRNYLWKNNRTYCAGYNLYKP